MNEPKHQPPDPWGQRPPDRRPTSNRFYLWLFLLTATIALVAFLAWQFPDGADNKGDWSRILYLVVLVAVVSTFIVVGRRISIRDTVKQAAAWLAIALILLVGYSYRFELQAVAERVLGEMMPERAQPVGERMLSLRAGEDGHFRVQARVNGASVRFLIDTGATEIVLSPADAQRTGYDLDRLNFDRTAQTANGVVRTAPVRLDTISLGDLELRGLPATVNEAEMRTSLLGMRFLRQLRSYEVRDDALIMRW